MHAALDPFHPVLKGWFNSRFKQPTHVQEAAWPVIQSGQHALVTAPTGSGKTLTAFFCALNRFASGDWAPGRTRVLYISPLKALNNDIRVNLMEPLSELKEQAFPDVRVQVRSGDTAQSDRQRMLRQPPDILITTPESLHLLLTTQRGQQALSTVEVLIVDEVHAVADNRRGAQLMVSIERLAHIAGEFQRIALSATVEPLDAVAAYVAGCRLDGTPRDMQIVRAADQKQLTLKVHFPEEAKYAAENGKKIWDPLADDFKTVIERNQSTLFFTNSRALAEKITLKINEDEPQPLAYAHHGSLARDIRTEVERRLKAGELRAIVATSSLEMGIDVGALDEVVLIQSPPSIAATLQRVGRAGHQVGAESRGALYPTHAHDFLEAAVLTDLVDQRRIEPLTPLTGALDVLVQVLVSMCAFEPRSVDELYQEITCAGSYADLDRGQFDLVIDMLAGRYAGARVRELKPRLDYDRIQGTVKARRGALLAMYSSGGNIPDRGYFTLRHSDSGNPIGELDEEFVWEATTGQVFTLGTQNWQIQRITHNDVMVRAASPNTTAPPFWRAESFNRSFFFSDQITRFLSAAEADLDAGRGTALQQALVDERGFEPFAAEELVSYLERQRSHTERALPHRHHVLFELVEGGPDGYRGPNAPKQLVIHTLWGGALNRPFGYALETALRASGEKKPEVHADDNAIVVQVKESLDPTFVLGLVTPDNLDTLLREGLERSGYFGARFRECAGRSLLLTKQRFNQRLPLWMSRLQAKKLMTATKSYSDFPVLLETWRTCLRDEFDLPALKELLGELQEGTCAWSFAHTRTPSPFASAVRFEQVSRYMYADDSPEVADTSALSADLIAAAVANPDLRPELDRGAIDAFEAKRQRLAPGYEPTDVEDLEAWLKERVLIPEAEWQAMAQLTELGTDATWAVKVGLDGRSWRTHPEWLSTWQPFGVQGDLQGVDLDPIEPLQACLEVLSFYGPRTRAQIEAILPGIPDGLWDELASDVRVVDEAESCFCDSENLEVILRLRRAQARVVIEPIAAKSLPSLWAAQQDFGRSLAANPNAVADVFERLSGVPAPVNAWLTDFVQSRLAGTTPADLDQACLEHGFEWQGCGNERMTLCFPEDVALRRPTPSPDDALLGLFQDPSARYTFQQMSDEFEDTARLNALWWQAVWSGALTSDGLAPLRDAASRRYSLASPTNRTSRRQRLRGLVRGWQGTWRLLEDPTTSDDPLTQLEHNKERTRVLLERYSVICRPIVTREGWVWRELFQALRIMELAGEVIQGYFVEGLPGPQFTTAAGLQQLQTHERKGRTWWLSAVDPAAPAGLGLDWPELPQRRSANYLAFCEDELALVVENHGKRLTYLVPPDHPELDELHAVLVHLVTRERRITFETINGTDARRSPYLAALGRVLNITSDHKAAYAQT